MKISQATAAAFSLIEVLCAILILGIALVGLTQGITAALASNKDSERQTRAALIAAGRIEALRAGGDLAGGDIQGGCGNALPHCRWTESIQPASPDGLHQVTVTVENGQTGKTIYTLRTLLFEPPLDAPWDRSTATGSRMRSRKSNRRRR